MVDVSDLHIPLRARISRYQTIESLYVAYNYFQLLQFNRQLDQHIQADTATVQAGRLKKGFFEWELDLLVLETLQQYPRIGVAASLRSWAEFSGTINAIKELENNISGETAEELGKTIWLELGRIAHRQAELETNLSNRRDT